MATQLAEPIESAPEVADNDTEQQSQAPRDFEAEAKQHGWTPKDEFKGDPSRWVDAETFVTRADEVMPLLKKKTEVQDREIAALKKAVSQQTRLLATADERAMARALADLKAQKHEAVEAGDTKAVDAIDEKIDTLKAEAKAPAAEPVTLEQAEEAYADFQLKNRWYGKGALPSASEVEAEARVFADALAAQNKKKADSMAPADFFAWVSEQVHAEFPALTAKQPRQKPASDVSPPTNGRGASGVASFASLPKDAQQACDKLARMGALPGKDLAEQRAYYAKNF
jgi:hypothetical protein